MLGKDVDLVRCVLDISYLFTSSDIPPTMHIFIIFYGIYHKQGVEIICIGAASLLVNFEDCLFKGVNEMS